MGTGLDPDAQLMLLVKKGDMAALETLIEKYKQPIVNFLYRMIHDFDEAEDIAQNVFVRVYQSAHRYTPSAKFSTWIFTIARRLCLNEIRRRSRHRAESLESSQTENDEGLARQFEDVKTFTPPETFLQGELAEKVEEALAALPEKQRVAIALCRQEELSYEEIARVLKSSVSATKSLIHRGREALKERLKPYLQSGQWDDSEPKNSKLHH